jgi:hypothetical protein
MDLLSPKDVMGILRVSLPMVYKLADRGKLPCVRFGIPGSDNARQKMCLRFKRADVLAFIEAHYSGETT